MLKFLAHIKIKHLFAGRKNNRVNIFRILFLVITIIYGVGFSYIIDHFEKTNPDMPEIIIRSLNLFAWLVILLRNSFPVYRPISYPFLIYPVPAYKKVMLQFILELLSPFFVYIVAFFCVLLLSNSYNLFDLAISAVIIINAVSAEQIFKCLLEQRKKWLWFFMFLINVTVLYFLMNRFWLESFRIFELVALVIISMMNFSGIYLSVSGFSSLPSVSHPIYRKRVFNGKAGYYSLLLARRNSLRITLGAAYIFKVVLFWAGSGNSTVAEGEMISILTAIGLLPALLFTYLFNNYFGYAREIWYYQGRINSMKNVFAQYVYSLLLPVFIDLLISIALWTQSDIPFTTFTFSYAISLLLFLIIGFSTSMILPVKISGKISFKELKSNTNFIAALVNIILAGVIINLVNVNYKMSIIVGGVVLILAAFGIARYVFTKWEIHISIFKRLF